MRPSRFSSQPLAPVGAAAARLGAVLGVLVLACALGAKSSHAAAATTTEANPPRSAAAKQATNSGPQVEMMIVGAGNEIVARPLVLTAPPSTVDTSHGSCAVAEGTPLAALVAFHRTRGPAFAVRDDGHCSSSSPSDSGGLVVYSLDCETDHGQNGWEYKVNNRVGATGAADQSGPFGTGHRLAPYSKLIWFWCQAVDGGCQRNLEVSAPASVRRGGTFQVRVLGYDNDGHSIGMSGARVSIGGGGSSATTNSSGRATLRAPSRRGRSVVRATRSGSVPSFDTVLQVQ